MNKRDKARKIERLVGVAWAIVLLPFAIALSPVIAIYIWWRDAQMEWESAGERADAFKYLDEKDRREAEAKRAL